MFHCQVTEINRIKHSYRSPVRLPGKSCAQFQVLIRRVGFIIGTIEFETTNIVSTHTPNHFQSRSGLKASLKTEIESLSSLKFCNFCWVTVAESTAEVRIRICQNVAKIGSFQRLITALNSLDSSADQPTTARHRHAKSEVSDSVHP